MLPLHSTHGKPRSAKSLTDKPEQFDPRLMGQQVIDLEQFAPICDKMK